LQFFSRLNERSKNIIPVNYKFNPTTFLNFSWENRQRVLDAAKNSASTVQQTLQTNHDQLEQQRKLIRKHLIVYHKKFSFSIACFLLFFIGAPLGAIIRKGGLGMPAVVSTLFFILFWVISFVGEKYAVEGELPAWQGIWLAPAVLLPIGIFLTTKATNDASLFDIDAWGRAFKKVFSKEKGL
jgi:lipopolysaccharide export system permease protein